MNKQQKIELFQSINYLNLAELKKICDKYTIPYKIHIEVIKNKAKKTSEVDRKGIILNRIKYFVNTGKIKKPTIFPKNVLSITNRLPVSLKSLHPIFYGEYKNSNKEILNLMKKLTNDKFEFGAIAQEVIRSCWAKGETPTFEKFAKLWLNAKQLHTKPNREWAYLADKHQGFTGKDWKKLRIEKAQKAIKLLNQFVKRPKIESKK